MLPFETICTLCFARYPPGEIIDDDPCCPQCLSEAMEVEVEAFDTFMASRTVEDFDDALIRWQQVEGFLPAYKAAKALRIESLRGLKIAQG